MLGTATGAPAGAATPAGAGGTTGTLAAALSLSATANTVGGAPILRL